MTKSTKSISIIGLGWLGLPLALELQSEGWSVKGTTTTTDKLASIQGLGIKAYHRFFSQEEEWNDHLDPLLDVEILVLCIPPGRRNPKVAEWYPELIKSLIEAAEVSGISKIIFTSSTSVYGPQKGRVLESNELQPVTASAKAVHQAERIIQESSIPHIILRLAGLYSLDRHPGRWLAGKTDLTLGNNRVNLVHRKDVISIIKLLLGSDIEQEVFSVCADEHPRKRDYYPIMCRKLELKAPTFVQDQSDDGKIVDNTKLKTSLSYQFHFPDPYILD